GPKPSDALWNHCLPLILLRLCLVVSAIGRYNVNDTKSPLLHLAQQQGQGKGGSFVNVMQQEDALPFAFETFDGDGRDLVGRDAIPIARVKVGTPDNQPEIERSGFRSWRWVEI